MQAAGGNRLVASKIPPDYAARTLARLLPSADEITSYDYDQLLALKKKKDELVQWIAREPIRFYRPNPGGQFDFMSCEDPSARVLLFMAGNKTGKTTAGAILVAERMLGRPLWGLDFRNFKLPTPAWGVVFAEDFDSHTEVTFPAYMSWCPKREIKNVIRNSAGHVVRIEHTNGSILYFRTYDQGSDRAEGKDWVFAWCDEPPDRNVYTAILRGMVALNGRLIITATLLKETWLYDEADKAMVRAFQASIYDNPWLSPEAVKDFEDSLSDEERAVRISGRPLSLMGLIYKEFSDSPRYVVPEQQLPMDWPLVLGVDPHERKPIHLLYTLICPDNELLAIRHEFVRGTVEEIGVAVKATEAALQRPIRLCVMDPNRGRAKQINELCWQEVFESFGYGVLLGVDDIRIGHTAVHNFLQSKPRPRFRFVECCRGQNGPIYQMLRYAWDDWARSRGYKTRDVKEKPRELNKDFPDIIRYLCMANLDFDVLKYGPSVIKRAPLLESYRWGGREASLDDLQPIAAEDPYGPRFRARLTRVRRRYH